jgi:hypothetical protein
MGMETDKLPNNIVPINKARVTITETILSVEHNMNVFLYKETFYNIFFSTHLHINRNRLGYRLDSCYT